MDFMGPESDCHAAPLGQNSGMMAFLLAQCANAIRKTERVGKPCDSPPQELITSLLSSSKPSPYQRSDIDTPSSLRAWHVDLAFSPPARVESDPPARNVCGLDDRFESADINEAVSRRSEGRASRARVVVHSDGEECDFRAPCWRHQLRPAGTDSRPGQNGPLEGHLMAISLGKDQKPRNLVGGGGLAYRSSHPRRQNGSAR